MNDKNLRIGKRLREDEEGRQTQREVNEKVKKWGRATGYLGLALREVSDLTGLDTLQMRTAKLAILQRKGQETDFRLLIFAKVAVPYVTNC